MKVYVITRDYDYDEDYESFRYSDQFIGKIFSTFDAARKFLKAYLEKVYPTDNWIITDLGESYEAVCHNNKMYTYNIYETEVES